MSLSAIEDKYGTLAMAVVAYYRQNGWNPDAMRAALQANPHSGYAACSLQGLFAPEQCAGCLGWNTAAIPGCQAQARVWDELRQAGLIPSA